MNILLKTLHRVSPASAEASAGKSETGEILKDDAPSANGSAILTTGQIFRALFSILKRKKIFVIAFVVIISVGVGIYERYFNLTDAERAQKELAAAITAVSTLMIIPEGDEPVLATVTDAEALTKQQAFFAGAVNGDQLLLFPRNLKAVIYSPSRNKIVNAGPIEQQPRLETTGSQANPVSNGASQNANVSSLAETTADRQNALTVEVRNGTGKSGLAAQVAENVRAAGFEVTAVTDAKNKNYSKTIAVSRAKAGSLAPLEASLLTGLAAQIGAELIANFPDGEKDTSADVLIILGNQE